MSDVPTAKVEINLGRQPRWDRFERADLFEQYWELRAQGISERQTVKELNVPRTTLQACRVWHDSLDICPHVDEFFQSGPGLAFLHRLVIAFHLVSVEVGACGIRLAQNMPKKDITLTQDETFTGGLCLVGMEPVSNFP